MSDDPNLEEIYARVRRAISGEDVFRAAGMAGHSMTRDKSGRRFTCSCGHSGRFQSRGPCFEAMIRHARMSF